MNWIVRSLVTVALVTVFLLAWSARTDQEVTGAEARKPIKVTRIFTGSDGQSHAEEIDLKISDSNASAMIKATSVQFRRTPPGYVNDWHVGPRRQFVITLSGRGEVEVAGGKKIVNNPGSIELIEDLTGKGHVTRVTSKEDRITISIPLADQTLGSGLP